MNLKDRFRRWSRKKALPYVLSVPERTLRSASAISAGLLREIADVALPIGVRRGRLYQNLVGVTLRFLIEDVGRVQGVYKEAALAEDFLLRRTAGNGIELVGILVFRASPVWVFAALADVCGWGRQLIPEIADALKAEGLLEPDRTFSNMDQLLDGLERTSAQLAETINAPPLNVASLREEWMKLKTEAQSIPAPALPSASVVTRMWRDMKDEAAAQQRTVFEISTAMALSAVGNIPERTRRLSLSAGTAARKGGAIVSVALLDYYRTTLAGIHQTGYIRYTAQQLSPYIRAAFRQFAPTEKTITDRFLKGR